MLSKSVPEIPIVPNLLELACPAIGINPPKKEKKQAFRSIQVIERLCLHDTHRNLLNLLHLKLISDFVLDPPKNPKRRKRNRNQGDISVGRPAFLRFWKSSSPKTLQKRNRTLHQNKRELLDEILKRRRLGSHNPCWLEIRCHIIFHRHYILGKA